jgi:adenosylcobinamide-phosphate synthase
LLRRGWSRRALGAAAGIVADRLLGEPPLPGRLHPVALFGTAALRLERRVYADSRVSGALFAGASVATAAGVGRLVRSSTAATYVATSGRGLHRAALDVAAALDRDDLDEARTLLPHLVGRDPAGLDAHGIARAVVESVAENTTDAVVAPAVWTLLLGPTGTLLHRAADTLDSMVGYRNERYRRFGTAAATLDDVLAWAPARVTAGLVALVRPRQAGAVWRVVWNDAARHPSPNAGVTEAAFAGALGVRLGGTNRYGDLVEHRPALGDGRSVEPADIPAAVALSRDVSWTLAGLLATAGTAGVVAQALRRPSSPPS